MTNLSTYLISNYLLDSIIRFLLIIIPLLIAIAYFTLFERKVMAAMHRRKGPNVVGFLGLLQPFADGLKLFVKEVILPTNANLFLFVLAPMITFSLSLMSWAVIPFASDAVYVDLDLGLLFILAISSLSVYGIIISGWASNSKYAFLGALRSTAQMISYEVSIGFLVVSVLLCTGSLNLGTIVHIQRFIFFCIPLFPVFIIFFVSTLAETNRHPFDLPEAESELVSGFNVEYSGFGFTLFFLGEYSNMLLMSSLNSILFLGGWLPMITIFGFTFLPEVTWFSLKIMFYVFLFVACRAAFPRYRYDQLMRLGWKFFLPISLFWLIVTSTTLYYIQGLPL